MAEATKDIKTIEKVVTTEEEVITLTLSRDEAEVIFALVGRTNASAPYSDTPASGFIFRALADALEIDWGGGGTAYEVVDLHTGLRAPTLSLKKEKL